MVHLYLYIYISIYIYIYIYIYICNTLPLDNSTIHLHTALLYITLEIDWIEVTVTFNDNKIELPRIVAIRIWDKIKVRRLMNREPFIFHMMIRQGITWFNLETEIPEIV